MKETRSLLNRLLACGVALAMVSTLAAQTVNQGVAKVVRLKGAARYATGSNAGQLLKVGDIIQPGSVIQTAEKSRLDLVLGDRSAPAARPVAGEMLSYHPTVDQNVVRMWENTLLGIDKLSVTQTGADEVTDTQLDLKAGHIFGMVKKMSAASKYEVKIPNGVAGIRGTIYDISAEGIVKVLSGSVVLAYVGQDGAVLTQVIMGLQEFDAPTNTLKPLPDIDKSGMEGCQKGWPGRPPPPRPPPGPPPPKPPSRWHPPGPH
jgi:hypothetical protein